MAYMYAIERHKGELQMRDRLWGTDKTTLTPKK
jgi:hypothetical protein